MAYDLDQFIADCRTTLARDPGPAGREQVRADLERLLANADFVSAYCGDDHAARTEGAVRGPETRLPDARPYQRQGAHLPAA